MKRKVIVNAIYISAGLFLLGLLLWYGAQATFSFTSEIGGGEAVSFFASRQTDKPDIEVPDFPQSESSSLPTGPAQNPSDEPLPLPAELLVNTAYRFDPLIIEFYESGNLRLFHTDGTKSIAADFTVISKTRLSFIFGGETATVDIAYRQVTVYSVPLSEYFGVINPLNPGAIVFSYV